MALPMEAEWWGGTCTIQPGRAARLLSQSLSAGSATTKMGWAEPTCTPRGGWITVSRTSRGGTTFGGGMGMPSYGFGFGMNSLRQYITDEMGRPSRNGGYGAGLKNDIRKIYGATVGVAGRGESVPQYDNYCEIDPGTVDEFGIPVLRFNYNWTDHEVRQAKHMQDTFEELLTSMGGELLGSKAGEESQYGLEAPGRIIHEVGTTRMGDDPDTSVLNKYSQAHECDNLFVVDAGSFVSQADKNPTWTILALSWRASDYIVDQLNKRNIG